MTFPAFLVQSPIYQSPKPRKFLPFFAEKLAFGQEKVGISPYQCSFFQSSF